MTPSTGFGAPARRWPVALMALLGHGLLLLALQSQLRGHPPATGAPHLPASTRVLVLLPVAAPAPTVASPPPARRSPAPAVGVLAVRPVLPLAAPAIRALTGDVLPGKEPPAAVLLPPDATGTSPNALAAAQPAQTSPAPLRLALPRTPPASAPPASWARRDERVVQPVSGSERFANSLGTDQTERRDTLAVDGATRIRRGTGCVLVKPSRDSQLDPFNQSVSTQPHQSGPC